MSDVIRHGTIIVDLVQGKAELKAPDAGPVIAAREKELLLIQQIEAAQKRLVDLQNSIVNQPGGGGAPGGGGGGGGAATPDVDHIEEAAQAQRELAAAYRETGEGVLRVGRAMVLFGGASAESTQRLVQGLAVVQGAYDLYAGSQKIVTNLAKAEAALAASQAATAAATIAATGATVANTAATTACTTATIALAAAKNALAVVTNPVTLAIAALAAIVMTAVEAFDYFTTSAEEAREAVLAEAKATEILTNAMANQIATMRQAGALRREFMTDAEKSASLAYESAYARASGNVGIDLASGKAPESEIIARKDAQNEYSAAANAIKERDAAEKSILDTQLRQKDNAIEQIKRQDDLVKAAQRQLDVEKQKADAQQAQIGRLSTLQQAQLRSLRDKLLRGEDLSRGEEKRLEDLGGEQGRSIVDARARKRAEAAGFGPDFFKGIEGASTGLDDAAKNLKEAADALKALTSGATAAAKIAEIDAEKQALEAQYQQIRQVLREEMEATIKLLQQNAERIHELEITTAINAAQQ